MSFQLLKELNSIGVLLTGTSIKRAASAMVVVFFDSLHLGIPHMRPQPQYKHLTTLGSMATLSCWRESRQVLPRSVFPSHMGNVKDVHLSLDYELLLS